MTLSQAIVLGIVQGLTEFLPVSSTAHLRIVPALLGWNDPGAAFTAVIQLGTLVAVLLYFSSDITAMTRGVVGGLRDGKPLETPEAKMGWMIVVGTVPVVIFGLLFKEHIETTLRSLYIIAGAMIALAVVLMLAEWRVRRRQRQGHALREMKGLGWADAIVVGCAQCVALIPGSSRSGCTITGGLFLGMTRETAARFSFLLSLPAVFAAGIFELIKARHELLATQQHAVDLAASTFVSFVVGYASIAFLLGYLKKHTTWLFIIYRLAMGGLLLALLANGRLQAF
ncbi:MAG: undecaprenyl-diphosphate phosphatase [Verrucomicrobiia bacterium]|jgi:undecaprenyl-diphosphatase